MDWFRRSLTGTSFITTRSISNFWKHLSCFLFFFFNSIGNTMRIVKHLFLDDWGLFFSRVLGWICHQKSSGQLLFTVVFLMALRSTLWKNDKERKKKLCVCVSMGGEKQNNRMGWNGCFCLFNNCLSLHPGQPYATDWRSPPSAYNTHLEFQIFSFFFSLFIFINVCLFERIRVLAGMPL